MGGCMATGAPSNPPCVIIDSNILIAICCKEAGRHALAHAELVSYASRGYEFFAPGCIVSECLYVLAEKLDRHRTLTPGEHAAALSDLCSYMTMLLPLPGSDFSLTARSEQIRSGYGASRSADGIFIAMAEELTATRATEILTFDTGLPRQASRNAPTVSVRVLPTVVPSAPAPAVAPTGSPSPTPPSPTTPSAP
jgi:predicted nucleic acid-binding protein